VKEKLKEKISTANLKHLPSLPGVYIMRDKVGGVIYVGKAKDIKKRIKSYFYGNDTRYSVQFLLEQIETIDTVIARDEQEALILESDLIKKFKPKYNIRLKDDKSHLMIRINLDAEWPRLELVRQRQDDGCKYFGPYVYGYELKSLLEVINKTIPLRTCSDRVMNNRVRPCLEYQIKRCAGPCCLEVDRSEYRTWVNQAIKVLEGKNEEVALTLEKSMEKASSEMRFEDAAFYRDRLRILENINYQKPITAVSSYAQDAFGICRQGANVEFSVAEVRNGRMSAAKTFGFSEVEIPDDELLRSLLVQYYQDVESIPEQIFVPFDFEDREFLENLFSDARKESGEKKQVKISVPQKGAKARLLALAVNNAEQNFKSRFIKQNKYDHVLEALQKELQLEQMPRVIECVDISHFQGGSTVASVVNFRDGLPNKQSYRMFHLAHLDKPDDFESMREIVNRHLSRCAEENTLADLIIIDGGKGQLSQSVEQRNKLGLQSPVMVGLAKKRSAKIPYLAQGALLREGLPKPERIYVEGASEPIVLDKDSEAMKLIERIRNEAHRFAITFHRKTRTKKTLKSDLDMIPGIGPKRRQLLLREFGSVKAIREALPQDVAVRSSIPIALATKVVNLLVKAKASRDKRS
jgi:excinuclease ABC subunit C